MKYRPLGRTGLSVSEIGVGAWQLGGPLFLDGRPDGHPDPGRAEAVRLIQACGDLGLNVVDTAEQYGAGESELRVGEALRGRRSRWVVCTKFGALVGPAGQRVSDASARRLPISLEGSLRRLRTDFIDIYLYHVPPDPAEAEAAAEFLRRAKEKGQVRAVGISTSSVEHARRLLAWDCLDVVQFPRNLLDPQDEIAAFVASQGLGGMARGALAGGRLSGKYFAAPPAFAPEDIRSAWFAAPGWQAEFTRCGVFGSERSPAQLALRFVLDHPAVHTVLTGAKNLEDFRRAAAAADLPPLTAAETARLSELRAELRGNA
ncbi:MAG: aldo/keto reductase [Elusimicrobiota bacterium]